MNAMAMTYAATPIREPEVPRAASPIFQHILDTYASETNKVVSVWRELAPQDFAFRPHPRSSSAEDIVKHQLLSERRFFGEFLGAPEPAPGQILPASATSEAYAQRMVQLALPRLAYLAPKTEKWWMEVVPFFDVHRQRIWVFWRRVLHTAHHRTQLTIYLRLLGKPVPSTYGPTADVTWQGADPTLDVEAAGRLQPPV
jgi:uncharacterized damage-inducible protein DinB